MPVHWLPRELSDKKEGWGCDIVKLQEDSLDSIWPAMHAIGNFLQGPICHAQTFQCFSLLSLIVISFDANQYIA